MRKMYSRIVVLINPRHRFGEAVFRAERTILPLGLLCVAAPLDIAGYTVKIIDQHTDLYWQDSLQSVLQASPICVGITCMTGPQIHYALSASALVKRHGRTPVVWGGTHPSLLPRQTLQNENIDIVVEGEGEETFLELVEALNGKGLLADVTGIWYKHGSDIKFTPQRPFVDLNHQPPPAYHLINLDDYDEKKFRYHFLRTFTSRGCCHDCAFCYNISLNRGKWRSLSAVKTIDRLNMMVNTYDFDGFVFCDDNFFVDLKRARDILTWFSQQQKPILLYKLDIRPDTLYRMDEEFLRLIRKSGCINVSIGIESGSERILKLLKKNVTREQIISINRKLFDARIIPSYTFMIGYPTETIKDVKQTLSLVGELLEDHPKAIKKIHIYTPLPGTELYELALQHGFEPPKDLQGWIYLNYRMINLPWLSRDRKRLFEMLHFCSIFLDYNSFFNPEIDVHPIIRVMAHIYRPFARWRVKTLFSKFLIEVRLAEWLGLYIKQVAPR